MPIFKVKTMPLRTRDLRQVRLTKRERGVAVGGGRGRRRKLDPLRKERERIYCSLRNV